MIILIYFLIYIYNYDGWFENEESPDTIKSDEELTDKKEPDMLQLEGDEEVKVEKRFKILTSNKLLTRFPILLAHIKAGNNLYNSQN